MNRARPVLLLAAALWSGCGATFTPKSVLEDLRVLAVAPDPPEVVGDGVLTLTATPYVPDPVNDPATRSWSFCPLTAGPNAGYRCVVPCDGPIPGATGDTLTASPRQLAEACLAQLGGELPADLSTLPARVETVFRYRVETRSGVVREAVARVFLHRTAPPILNTRSPAITAVEIAGAAAAEGVVAATAAPGAKVPITVRIDPASLETYVDEAGVTRAEQVVVEVYTTQGRFEFARGEPPVASFELELKELGAGASEALVYAVTRDLRGGQQARGPFRVAIR